MLLLPNEVAKAITNKQETKRISANANVNVSMTMIITRYDSW
jgi:hypothetical protein